MSSIGDTQSAVLKQDIIMTVAQRELIQSVQLLGTIYDVSQFAEKGAGKISFPKAGHFTVAKFATTEDDATAPTPQALTFTEDELTLDQHAYVLWSIKDKASYQSRLNLEIDSAARAGRAHGADLDSVIYAALLANATAYDFSGADVLTKLSQMVAQLRTNKVPTTPGTIFAAVSPAVEQQILTSSSNPIIDASKYGNQLPLVNGEIGMLFGARIVVTTSCTDANPVVYHQEACAIGFDWTPRLQSQYDVKKLQYDYNMDQLYGIKALNGLMAVKHVDV